MNTSNQASENVRRRKEKKRYLQFGRSGGSYPNVHLFVVDYSGHNAMCDGIIN